MGSGIGRGVTASGLGGRTSSGVLGGLFGMGALSGLGGAGGLLGPRGLAGFGGPARFGSLGGLGTRSAANPGSLDRFFGGTGQVDSAAARLGGRQRSQAEAVRTDRADGPEALGIYDLPGGWDNDGEAGGGEDGGRSDAPPPVSAKDGCENGAVEGELDDLVEIAGLRPDTSRPRSWAETMSFCKSHGS
mmetsp:Transcript_74216/g.240023  ORF Transcript_74216/g.240023 Transcript_74216/m.240023 type:complete len:189 (+) Transcript_74216:400-966(+)